MDRNEKDKKTRRGISRETVQMKAAGFWDVVSDAVRNFSRNGDDNQAAAIAFYTILSVIPLFLLTIIAAGSFFSSNPHIQEDILNAIKGFHPYFSDAVLIQLGQIEGKRQLLGWIGVLGLVWLSLAIFNAIESALNIIFRSRERRNYFTSKLMAFGMIPLGWVIGGLSVLITYAATLFAASPLVLPGGMEVSLTLPAEIVLRYILPYTMVLILVTAVYKIIPTVKIRLPVALTGAAVFGFLLEVAKQFFTWYLARYTRYNLIFGSLETVVILVIWVFYIALIFLFCAEIMSSYERRNLLLLERALLAPHADRMKVEERLFEKFGRTYPKDSIIFSEGEKGREMFYILTGRVCLERADCSVEKTLAELGPGQYFGEMAVLIDIQRSATARALEDSHLAVIDAATFQNLIRESQDVAIAMLREFSSRLKRSNETLEEFTSLWTRMMIVIHFLNLKPVKIVLEIPFLAAQSGKNPAEIEALIHELALQNILRVEGGTVVDVDRQNIWSLFEADALKKCLLEEREKMFAGVIRK
jgi:membrane protein